MEALAVSIPDVRIQTAAAQISFTYGADNGTEGTAAAALAASDAVLTSPTAFERTARTLCKADYPLQEDFDRYWELLGEAHYVPLAAKVIAELLNGTAGE